MFFYKLHTIKFSTFVSQKNKVIRATKILTFILQIAINF
jgi:hypothetical protein